MIQTIEFDIPQLKQMKKIPNDIFYIGNTKLLEKSKVSIVGSRSPNQYARAMTYEISSKLSQQNVCIVSGGAIGIDTVAHKAAGCNNTIMISATGLDKRYPSINNKMIEQIETQGLVLSQFKPNTPSARYNFPLRNELIVALGDILIVSYADINSGTKRSIEYALKMKKDIFVLPHRLNESQATNELLKNNKAKAIYDIDEFISQITKQKTKNNKIDDEILDFCKTSPSYEDALSKYGDKLLEYELNNLIVISSGKVYIK